MNKSKVITCLAAMLLLSTSLPLHSAEPKEKKPQVEVVFCLDTTGSMGGLIEAAKQKIWAISNQIASGKPVPDLKIGLVAYRDRKDQYVTKIFELTDDLDAVHGHLRKFTAAGGGDGPESVNQALHEAVTKINWSKDAETLKIVFLVGDAPPHMDYKGEVQYPETCQLAVKNNIIINSVQCGRDGNTTKIWQDISRKSEGSYVAIAQNGGAVAVATPFDKRLNEINRQLARGTLVFGRGSARDKAEEKKADAEGLGGGAGADRAGFLAKGGKVATYDLIDALKDNRVKLSELKKEELPKALQGKTLKQQQEVIKKIEEGRKTIQKEAIELDKKRSDFIKKELEKRKGKTKDSFDLQVLKMLRNQAKKHNIKY